MKNWTRITFTEGNFGINQALVLREISDAFLAQAARGSAPQPVALFATATSWEKVDFYFSPELEQLAADLVQKYGGEVCDPPAPEGLALLFAYSLGDPWKDLLGGHPRRP